MMKAGTMMISYQPLGELPNFFRSIISNQVCIEGMKFLVSVLHRIVKLGSRSKVHLKSLIRDLDLELVAIIAMSPTTQQTFLSRITLKSLHV